MAWYEQKNRTVVRLVKSNKRKGIETLEPKGTGECIAHSNGICKMVTQPWAKDRL